MKGDSHRKLSNKAVQGGGAGGAERKSTDPEVRWPQAYAVSLNPCVDDK